MEPGHDHEEVSWQGLGIWVSTHMTHWQYPPCQWPQVKLLTMVRKVAFGVPFWCSFNS